MALASDLENIINLVENTLDRICGTEDDEEFVDQLKLAIHLHESRPSESTNLNFPLFLIRNEGMEMPPGRYAAQITNVEALDFPEGAYAITMKLQEDEHDDD